jgi:hypothetical protein
MTPPAAPPGPLFLPFALPPLKVLRATLEAAGVEFIEENGGGPGVRLRRDG